MDAWMGTRAGKESNLQAARLKSGALVLLSYGPGWGVQLDDCRLRLPIELPYKPNRRSEIC